MESMISNSRLNDLSGSKWIAFTKKWFVLSPSSRKEKIIHPASFSEELVRDFIEFFTKVGDLVIDPFAGTGTTLKVSKQLGRNSLGIELYPEYADFARGFMGNSQGEGNAFLIQGDSRKSLKDLKKKYDSKIDFCITSPPYWSQLNECSERNLNRKDNGLQVKYGELTEDLGTIENYEQFLKEQEI